MENGFDPDKYLKEKEAPQKEQAFDPDAFLKKNESPVQDSSTDVSQAAPLSGTDSPQSTLSGGRPPQERITPGYGKELNVPFVQKQPYSVKATSTGEGVVGFEPPKPTKEDLTAVQEQKAALEKQSATSLAGFERSLQMMKESGRITEDVDGNIIASDEAASEEYNQIAQSTKQSVLDRAKKIEELQKQEVGIKSQIGSYGGFVRNESVNAYTQYMKGVSNFVLRAADAVAGGDATADEITKITEDMFAPFREQLSTSETTKEYAEKIPFIPKALGGAAAQIPTMLTPYASGIFFQSYATAADEVADMDLSPAEKEIYKLTSATLETGLERLPLGLVLKNNPVLKKFVVGEVMSKVAKEGAQESVETLAAKSIDDVALRYGKDILKGGAAEGLTGAAQEASNLALKEGINAITKGEGFKTDTMLNYTKQVLEAGAAEAVGGIGLTTAFSSIAAFRDGKLALANAQDIKTAQMVATPDGMTDFTTAVDAAVESEQLTPEDGESIKEAAGQFAETVSKIPEEYRENPKVIELVAEKQNLIAQNKTLDPAFQEKNKAKIEAIDNELLAAQGIPTEKDETQATEAKPEAVRPEESGESGVKQAEAEKAKELVVDESARIDATAKELEGKTIAAPILYHEGFGPETTGDAVYLESEEASKAVSDEGKPYHVFLDNPYTVKNDEDFKMIESWIKAFRAENPNAKWHPDTTAHVNGKLKEQGYDGLIIKDEALQSEYGYDVIEGNYGNAQTVVFNKSAVVENTPQAISAAYHKAKSSGSNPALVKAVEELGISQPNAAKPPQTTPESKLKAAAQKWIAAKGKQGIIYDPKQKAEEDAELFSALVEYVGDKLKQGAYTIAQFVEDMKSSGLEMVNHEEVFGAAQETKESPKSPRQVRKVILGRAYEGQTDEYVKEQIAKHGLTREVESELMANEIADSIIADIGLDEAVDAVLNYRVNGAPAALIFGRALNALQGQIKEGITQAEQEAIIAIQAELVKHMEARGVEAGRFSKGMDWVYDGSEFTFSYEKMREDYMKSNRGEISPEMEAKFKRMADEMDALRKSILDLQEKQKKHEEQALVNAIGQTKRKPDSRKQRMDEGRKEIAEGLDELMDFMGAKMNIVGDKRPQAVAAITKIGSGLIKVGDATIDNVIEKIKELIKQRGGDPSILDEIEPDIIDAVRAEIESFVTSGKLRIPLAMIRDKYEAGAKDIDSLVEAVKTELLGLYPDITDREVRDAISGYGRTQQQSRDDIAKDINRMKRVMRIFSGLEDIRIKKQRPKRSGKQRDAIDAEERALLSELREAMKDLPMDVQTLASQQKTALDAAKTRIKNEIERYDLEIERGEAIPKSKRTLQEDAELTELKAKRDAKRAERDEAIHDEEIEEAKRLSQAKVRTQKLIERYEQRMKDGDYAVQKKKPIIADTELSKKQAQLRILKDDFLTERYKAEREKRAGYKKLLSKILDTLGLSRMAVTGMEMSFIGIQNGQWVTNYGLKALAGLFGKGENHAAKVLGEAFRQMGQSLASEKRAAEINAQIRTSEYYPSAKDAGVAITEPDARARAKEESAMFFGAKEIWNSILYIGLLPKLAVAAAKGNQELKKAFEDIPNSKAYKVWNAVNPILALERGNVGLSNAFRIAKYLEGADLLHKEGIKQSENPEAFKNVADVVNTLSFRSNLMGLEKSDEAAKGLAVLFMSARMLTSLLKTATPMSIIWAASLSDKSGKGFKPSVAQKMALTEYMTWFTTTTGLVLGLAAILNNDDDDETEVSFDPRSSDFMTIKLGNTRIDPWRGYRTLVVFESRLFLNAVTYAAGKRKGQTIKPGMQLGFGDVTKTKKELGVDFLSNKFAPAVKYAWDVADLKTKIGPDGEEITFGPGGKPEDAYTLMSNLYTPIFAETLEEIWKEQPEVIASYMTALAFVGTSVNTYGQEGTGEKPKVGNKVDPWASKR